jgi:hypothetical protein
MALVELFGGAKRKSPPAWSPAGLGVFLEISLAVTSGHGSPPTWKFHDGGDGRDEGCSASE